MKKRTSGPSRDRLYEVASAQDGYFTLEQANSAGFSSQLLHDYLKDGRVILAAVNAAVRAFLDPVLELGVEESCWDPVVWRWA